MSPLKKILSLSVGLVVLGTLLIVINTGTGSAQNVHLNDAAAAPTIPAIPVTVANTPLPVTGTVTANISGTPTVNANINGTPNVNATIVNPSSSPLLVRDVDAGRSPFEIRLTFNIDDGSAVNQTQFDVPSGKRLVIEHVSARVQGPAGQK
jgi:hypothetical protein